MEITDRSDILEAASRIYAGCLASGKVSSKNEQDTIRYSLHIAVAMAQTVEQRNIFTEGGKVLFPW
ncbi:MAG: hypothetical protein MAG794_01338 [Gammaproteobacteria bacterium]|nr:hypothetical protein [Gammaproteobacteria bacterium]